MVLRPSRHGTAGTVPDGANPAPRVHVDATVGDGMPRRELQLHPRAMPSSRVAVALRWLQRLIGAAPVTALLTACSSSPSLHSDSCLATIREPLVNGAPQETYLGLSAAQVRAVVKVIDLAHPDAGLCTGTFVAPGWVVTAKHCVRVASTGVVVQGASPIPTMTFSVGATVSHPILDVALLNVEVLSGDAGAIT